MCAEVTVHNLNLTGIEPNRTTLHCSQIREKKFSPKAVVEFKYDPLLTDIHNLRSGQKTYSLTKISKNYVTVQMKLITTLL